MRSSSYTEQHFVKSARGSRRELEIDSFSQTQISNVWYYRVNVSVHEEVLMSTFIAEDSSDDDEGDRSSGASMVTTDVEHYSILRRYSDFLQLHEQVCAELNAAKSVTSTLPPFPGKELISPALKGMLRRESSSKTILEDRSAKFAALLR